jgi:photosystem II stability/assembly factor-like uncharacterized protein
MEEKEMQKLVFVNGNEESINLTAGNFGITNWAGLSNADLNLQTQQVPFQDGSVFIDALLNNREISVTLAINDDKDLYKRYQLKREVISALNPKFGEGYLYYTNDFYSRRIKCVPQLPVFENKNSNDSGTLKASLVFIACGVYWEDIEETVVAIPKGGMVKVFNNSDIAVEFKFNSILSGVNELKLKNLTTQKYVEVLGVNDCHNVSFSSIVGEKNVLAYEDMLKNFSYFGRVVGYCSAGEVWLIASYALYTSKDLENFSLKSYSNIRSSHKIRCINGKIFYLYNQGSDGSVEVSSDNGETWNRIFDSSEINPYDIVFFNNKYYLVGTSGTDKKPIWTSDDLETWVAVEGLSTDIYGMCACVTPNDIIFVGGVNIYRYNQGQWSPSTITWLGEAKNLASCAYSPLLNKTVVVGDSGTILVSISSYEWIQIQSITENNLNEVIWSEQLSCFIAVGTYGTMLVSYDAESWKVIASGTNKNLTSIAFSNNDGIFITGNEVLKGTLSEVENITWVTQRDISSIVYVPEMQLICCAGYDIVNKKNNSKWENVSSTDFVFNIEYLKRRKEIIVFQNVGGKISFDGVSWEPTDMNLGASGAYSEHHDILYSVGFFGAILKSIDGGITNTLIRPIIGGDAYRYSIAYSDKLNALVVVGKAGFILKSFDGGETWEEGYLGNKDFSRIRWFEESGLFVILGGKSFISNDGVNWTEIFISGNDICYSKERNLYCIVGRYKVTFTSDFINTNTVSSTVELNSCCYNDYEHSFYFVGVNGSIQSMSEGDTQNIIDRIAEGSDLTIALEKGENKLLLTTDAGSAISSISYRQKYIGV